MPEAEAGTRETVAGGQTLAFRSPASGLDHSGGFLTRALGGVARVEGGQAWAETNGLTSRLNFSHNLSRVFPADLHTTHPEFFPLVDGVRLKPAKGAQNWNPDLGREDVAAFAAQAARDYFEANPDAVSFAVGTNDGLTFGESEETLALVRKAGEVDLRPEIENTPKTERGGVDQVAVVRRPAQRAGVQGGSEGILMPAQRAGLQDAGNGIDGTPARRAGLQEGGAVFDNSAYEGEWFRQRPDFSRLVYTFVNRVAEDLARTHPEKYVGALAYYFSENAPDFPLHPQAIPFLTADRSQGYDRVAREEERALQMRWGARGRAQFRVGAGARTVDRRKPESGDLKPEAGADSVVAAPVPERRMGIYDYLYGNAFLIPRIHTKLIADHLRHARRAGFTDYYAEVNPNWGLDGPMPWLVARLLQDPEQSREGLLEEYYAGHFQEAALPMRRFFEGCERQWMTQPGRSYWLKHFKNESQARLFPSAACGQLRAWLEEARRRARDGATRRRVELVRVAFGVTERFVAMQEARDALNEAALRGVTEWRILGAALFRFAAARDDFVIYTRRVLTEMPMAVSPFSWLDYLRHDPMTNAVAVLRGMAERAGEIEAAEKMVRAMSRDAALMATWAAFGKEATAGHELVRDGEMRGALKPPRNIAGLNYGLPLEEGWLSRVEPAEFQRAEVFREQPEPTAGRVLRLTGNKETVKYQWNPAVTSALHVAEIKVRGKVSPSNVVLLSVDWQDGAGRRVGLQTHRLPEGQWNEWVTLRVAGMPPAGARWVGMGLHVQNQMGNDWVEAREFSVRAFAP